MSDSVSQPRSQFWLLVTVIIGAVVAGPFLQSVAVIRFWLLDERTDPLYAYAVLVTTAVAPLAVAVIGRRMQASRSIATLMAAATGGVLATAAFYPLVGTVWGLLVGSIACYADARAKHILSFALRLACACLIGALGVYLARRVLIDGGSLWWGAFVVVLITGVLQFVVVAVPASRLLPVAPDQSARPNKLAWCCFMMIALVAMPASWVVGWRSELSRRIRAIEATGGSVQLVSSNLPRLFKVLYDLRPSDLVATRIAMWELVVGRAATEVILDSPRPHQLRTLAALNGAPRVSLTSGQLADSVLATLPLRIQQSTIAALGRDGTRLRSQGKYAQAASVLEQYYVAQCRLEGVDHPSTYQTMHRLGQLYTWLDRLELAEEFLEKYVKAGRSQPSFSISALAELAEVRLSQNRFDEAEALSREFLQLAEAQSTVNLNVYNACSLLGSSLTRQGRFSEAEPMLLRGYQGLAARGDTAPWVRLGARRRAVERLVFMYEASGQPEKADQWRGMLAP